MKTTHEICHIQQIVDNFYLRGDKNPCCAGCDWWEFHNSMVGDCKKSAPVSGDEKIGLLGVESLSMQPKAGHVMTKRDHSCGDFVDSFDWSSL